MDPQGARWLPALHVTFPGSTKACRVGKAKCWWLLGNFKPSYKYNLHKSIKFQIVKRGERGEHNTTPGAILSADQRINCIHSVWFTVAVLGQGGRERLFLQEEDSAFHQALTCLALEF